MTLLAPLGLLGLLVGLPILALYVLRLRRREVVVSSHFLWQQVLQDLAANTPFQRLRRHTLLFLQLAIVALLALALARLAWTTDAPLGGHVLLLVDASASMQARQRDGSTRFEDALRQAQAAVTPADRVTLVLVDHQARLLLDAQPASSPAAAAAWANARAGAGGADWAGAFTLALARANAQTRALLFSDNDRAAAHLPDALPNLRVVPIGEAAQNLALTAFALRALPDGTRQLFAEVFNASDTPARGTLTLRRDGALWRSLPFSAPARARTPLVLPAEGAFAVLQGRIVADPPFVDALAADDTAWAIAPQRTQARVLLMAAEGERFVSSALASLEGVQVFRTTPERRTLPQGAFDLFVLVDALPDTLPDGNLLLINPPHSSALFTLSETLPAAQNPRTQLPQHPLNLFVAWEGVTVRATRAATAAWAQTLASVGEQPFVLAGEQAGRRVVLLPFALNDTDLPLQVAFPVFIANAVAWLTPSAAYSERTHYRAGETVLLTLPLAADTARVRTPDGATHTLARGAAFPFSDALGVYAIDALAADGQLLGTQFFAVTLFDAEESDLTPRSFDVPPTANPAPADDGTQHQAQELWGALLLAAFALLLLEWTWYHRQWRLG